MRKCVLFWCCLEILASHVNCAPHNDPKNPKKSNLNSSKEENSKTVATTSRAAFIFEKNPTRNSEEGESSKEENGKPEKNVRSKFLESRAFELMESKMRGNHKKLRYKGYRCDAIFNYCDTCGETNVPTFVKLWNCQHFLCDRCASEWIEKDDKCPIDQLDINGIYVYKGGKEPRANRINGSSNADSDKSIIQLTMIPDTVISHTVEGECSKKKKGARESTLSEDLNRWTISGGTCKSKKSSAAHSRNSSIGSPNRRNDNSPLSVGVGSEAIKAHNDSSTYSLASSNGSLRKKDGSPTYSTAHFRGSSGWSSQTKRSGSSKTENTTRYSDFSNEEAVTMENGIKVIFKGFKNVNFNVCNACGKRLAQSFAKSTRCDHLFCDTCLLEWIKNNDKCPYDNKTISEIVIFSKENENENEPSRSISHASTPSDKGYESISDSESLRSRISAISGTSSRSSFVNHSDDENSNSLLNSGTPSPSNLRENENLDDDFLIPSDIDSPIRSSSSSDDETELNRFVQFIERNNSIDHYGGYDRFEMEQLMRAFESDSDSDSVQDDLLLHAQLAVGILDMYRRAPTLVPANNGSGEPNNGSNEPNKEVVLNYVKISKGDLEFERCPICWEDNVPALAKSSECDHIFCADCLVSWVNAKRNQQFCPLDRNPIRRIDIYTVCEDDSGAGPSNKADSKGKSIAHVEPKTKKGDK